MGRERVLRVSRGGLALCIALLIEGCGATQKLYSDESLARNEVARIRTEFSEKSGRITRRVTVESIDDEKVDSGKCRWVAVLPGTHHIEVSFYKRIDPAGLNIPVKLNLFGAETDLVKPEPSEVITSIVNQDLRVTVEAAKSYHIVAGDDIREAELPPHLAFLGDLPVGRRLEGSWTPRIIEER